MIPAQDTSQPDETSLSYPGWRVVFACFLIALFLFGFGLYGHGVYLAELQRQNGWAAALISGASTLSLLLANIFATFTNELVARLGAKRLVLLGIAALAASMTLLNLGELAVAALRRLHPDVARLDRHGHDRDRGGREPLVRAPSRPCHQPCVHRRQFRRDRRHAFARASCRTVWLCDGDADGDGGHGCASLYRLPSPSIGPPSAAGSAELRQRPMISRKLKFLRSGEVSRTKLLRSMALWTISIPFALALMAQIAFIVHQIALLEPKIGRGNAGFAVSVMTVHGDRWPPRPRHGCRPVRSAARHCRIAGEVRRRRS